MPKKKKKKKKKETAAASKWVTLRLSRHKLEISLINADGVTWYQWREIDTDGKQLTSGQISIDGSIEFLKHRRPHHTKLAKGSLLMPLVDATGRPVMSPNQGVAITMAQFNDMLGTATITPADDMTGKECLQITAMLFTALVVPPPPQAPPIMWRQFIKDNKLERHFNFQPHPTTKQPPGNA